MLTKKGKKIVKEIAIAATGLFIMFSTISFMLGLIDGGNSDYGYNYRCSYRSIISYNPGYAIGCELARPRFKGKDE